MSGFHCKRNRVSCGGCLSTIPTRGPWRDKTAGDVRPQATDSRPSGAPAVQGRATCSGSRTACCYGDTPGMGRQASIGQLLLINSGPRATRLPIGRRRDLCRLAEQRAIAAALRSFPFGGRIGSG